jgi:DNA modification methylase
MQTEITTENEVLDPKIAEVIEIAQWQFRYPMNAEKVKWDDVQMDERSRKDFGNLEELALSIQKNGLIHPPTVTIAPPGAAKPYTLVGGERRMRAMKMLEVPFFPVNLREALEYHEVLELELMENFHRKEMLWQEQCILIARTHREKERVAAVDSKTWGVRETGRLLGVSIGHVSHATTLAPKLIAGDAELLAAPSMFAAYEILLKRQEDLAMKLSTQDLNATAARAITGIHQTSDDVDDIFGSPDPASPFGAGGIDDFVASQQISEPKAGRLNMDFSRLFMLGDCIELMPNMQDECVDHVVTDPPYGIDLAMMPDIKNIENVVDTHDVEQNISMFEPFLRESFRLLKPSGYCVFWYDLDHHEKLQALGKAIGFKVQRWPIVWHKLHPCLNNAPRVNFTKNVEFAMVMRKGAACLVEPQTSSVFGADGSADRKLYDNPFAKPLAAWKFILNAIAYKGQSIFDPYAGQMSCGRACVNMGLIPMGIEIDENHYNRGIVQLTGLQKEINGH